MRCGSSLSHTYACYVQRIFPMSRRRVRRRPKIQVQRAIPSPLRVTLREGPAHPTTHRASMERMERVSLIGKVVGIQDAPQRRWGPITALNSKEGAIIPAEGHREGHLTPLDAIQCDSGSGKFTPSCHNPRALRLNRGQLGSRETCGIARVAGDAPEAGDFDCRGVTCDNRLRTANMPFLDARPRAAACYVACQPAYTGRHAFRVILRHAPSSARTRLLRELREPGRFSIVSMSGNDGLVFPRLGTCRPSALILA